MMTLYDYYRSSACYRVRIALNLKEIDYDKIPVDLVKNGGEHLLEQYRAVNPQGLVPVLQVDNLFISQSMSIIEYIEEQYPQPALLPASLTARAYVRSIANVVSCDMHPLNNLRVLKYLKHKLHCDTDVRNEWYHHWLKQGFDALEGILLKHASHGNCCYQDTPGLADIFLIPQVYNALRYEFSMQEYRHIMAIYEYCCSLEAFKDASPDSMTE